MIKKIDKLVLKSFWGPFFLTLCVVIFIFLMRLMMFYVDQFVSKDIDLLTFGKVLFYFSLNTVPIALPLAVLLSSLMTFGNLGEFFELTAMKSAGISMTRILRPILAVAVCISVFSFWFNNKVAPWANLKGYSLLYDIKSAKATLNLKEGIFYNDLPGYSIKADKKMKDNVTLKRLVIYKHQESGVQTGNREIILADSGRMYTSADKQYLFFELFNGNDYTEYSDNSRPSFTSTGVSGAQFLRNSFRHYKLVISLASFGLKRTDEQQFEYHEYMKNLNELSVLTDSLKKDFKSARTGVASTSRQYYSYQFKPEQTVTTPKPIKSGKWVDSVLALPLKPQTRTEMREMALGQARNVLSFAESNEVYLREKEKVVFRYELESHHKFTQAISCFIMFLIGAPLGAIIKKGGFGVPVLVSILFFILLYVLTLTGDKYAKEGLVWVPMGAWLANASLLPVGLFFMQKARNDSRLFDKDVYLIWWERLRAGRSLPSFDLTAFLPTRRQALVWGGAVLLAGLGWAGYQYRCTLVPSLCREEVVLKNTPVPATPAEPTGVAEPKRESNPDAKASRPESARTLPTAPPASASVARPAAAAPVRETARVEERPQASLKAERTIPLRLKAPETRLPNNVEAEKSKTRIPPVRIVRESVVRRRVAPKPAAVGRQPKSRTAAPPVDPSGESELERELNKKSGQ